MEEKKVKENPRQFLEDRILQHFDPSKVITSDLISDGEEEYIITLKNKEDLDQFYDDLETHGGTECVPDRCVECAIRRPISRNTHYILTAEEVEILKNDPRVLSIIPKKIKEQRIVKPLWEQSSNAWNKSFAVSNTHRNWALLRCIEGQQRSNWGSNGTTSVTGIVTATSSGKNVDVVIVDGFVNPNHPEMAVNEDGTGGTRVVQFNWYSLNSIVTGNANGTYPYTIDYNVPNLGNNDHGMHVAGTACGNSQGWARDAKVYNLYIYDNSDAAIFWADYIRAFHLTKPINSQTGLRNPTIINNSWGYANYIIRSNLTGIVWRGTTYNAPFTDAQLESFGVINYFPFQGTDYIGFEFWFEDDLADMQDAMNDGVIFVGAAGNSSYKIDAPGGVDYDNRLIGPALYGSGNSFYYHRGSVNTSGANAICVGAIGNLANDSKVNFSCTGPRITVYSPGTSIISSTHSGPEGDYRNSTFRIDKYSGTSMASPQICGVLACALEQYPRMTHVEAIEYIQGISKNQIFEPASTPYIDQGLSSISNTVSKLAGTENFIADPNTSVRIVTTASGGTITPTTSSLIGGVGIASTTPNYFNPSFSPEDDGFWELTLPFNISYNETSYNKIFVNTNSYVLFGAKPSSNSYDADVAWTYNTSTPTIPKIQISTDDGSAQRIWTNTTGSSPNREYRVRFEGHTVYFGGVLGSPTLVWEMVFFENASNTIDLHMGANPRVSLYNPYLDFQNLQGSGNRYLFYRQDRPIKGTIQPRVAERVRKTSGQTWPRMGTLRYKQS